MVLTYDDSLKCIEPQDLCLADIINKINDSLRPKISRESIEG